jgi:hypothetical protein
MTQSGHFPVKIRKLVWMNNMELKMPRGRIFGEFVLVVLGVLVALTFDSWMEQRNDDNLRREYLGRLADDLETDRQNYQYRIAFHSDVRTFARQTLDALRSEAHVDQEDLLAAYYASEIFTLTPISNTYEDLQNTGNIRLLRDIELRLELSSYHEKTVRERLISDEGYRKIVRGIIPWEIQRAIRKNCPTLDVSGEIPTGFPPCKLPQLDTGNVNAVFNSIRAYPNIIEILTYRVSDVDTAIYLLEGQKSYVDAILVRLNYEQ